MNLILWVEFGVDCMQCALDFIHIGWVNLPSPSPTTKWSQSTRLETRTKESNVHASMRVILKLECEAKAKI